MTQGRRIPRAAFAEAWNNPDLTTDDIAAMFGVYRTSVSRMGRARGLPPRKTGSKPQIKREPFASMWMAGVSTAEIAKALGLSRNYTGVLARRMGLPNRQQGTRQVISMDDYRAAKLREALAARAAEEQAALRLAEMVDGRRDQRSIIGKRAA